ncbi:MAG: PQQ-binding-like beta-propeller repeat protein, partial [Bacteroidales bacterium]
PHWNNSVFHTPIIHNEKIYANVGYSIVCHDLMTGEQLWRRNFINDFLFSGFIIEENKIIAMCEDTILYCLDPETGSTIWEGEGAGTSNKMSYLNGIVYFIGGSTRKLHAVDVSSGRTVWQIDPRNLGDEYSKFGPSSVCVIEGKNGEKGKVVAFTTRYAICYEAYK